MDSIHYHYVVDGDDFSRAGEASSSLKSKLKQLGFPPEVIRRCSIAIYEGEINMVIHADGGDIDVDIYPDKVLMVLKDRGPGIPDIDLAMQAGWSTAKEQIHDLGFGAGMGLPNMKKSSDEMSIETEIGVGTTVTIQINVTNP